MNLKIFFTFLFIVIECNFVLAQKGWQQISAPGMEFPNAISFADDIYGTVTGFLYIHQTTDGGLTWNSISLGNLNYSSVKFVDNNTGFLIGRTPTSSSGLYRTTNKGLNWNRIYQSSTIGNFFFLNGITGYCSEGSGSILKTTNGGFNWINQTNNFNISITSIYFSDVNNGMIIDIDGRGQTTTNAGLSWDKIFLATGFGGKISCPESTTAYVISNITSSDASVIRKSKDFGIHFSSVYFNKYPLTDIYFHDSNTGIVIGHHGIILKTTNGGINWYSQNKDFSNYFSSICFINNNTGWIVDSQGIIFKTTTGGDYF